MKPLQFILSLNIVSLTHFGEARTGLAISFKGKDKFKLRKNNKY
jgi:hypothetical protein